MNSRFKTPVIDDVEVNGIETALQENLLDLFEQAMKSVASTLIREAKFNTSDFTSAKRRDCEGFTLTINRLRTEDGESWRGEFNNGEMWLTVVGRLE